MGSNNSSEVNKKEDSSLSIFIEYQWNFLSKAADTIRKLVTYYLTILAGLVGYIIISDLSPEIKNLAINLSIVISILAIIAIGAIGWAFLKGLERYRKTFKKFHEIHYENLNMKSMTRKAKLVFKIVALCGICALGLILYGLKVAVNSGSF